LAIRSDTDVGLVQVQDGLGILQSLVHGFVTNVGCLADLDVKSRFNRPWRLHDIVHRHVIINANVLRRCESPLKHLICHEKMEFSNPGCFIGGGSVGRWLRATPLPSRMHECGSIDLPLISEGESAAASRRWRKRFSCLPLQNPGAADPTPGLDGESVEGRVVPHGGSSAFRPASGGSSFRASVSCSPLEFSSYSFRNS